MLSTSAETSSSICIILYNLEPQKKLLSNNLSSLELLNIIIVLLVAKFHQALYYVYMSSKNMKFVTFTLSVINLVYTGQKNLYKKFFIFLGAGVEWG